MAAPSNVSASDEVHSRTSSVVLLQIDEAVDLAGENVESGEQSSMGGDVAPASTGDVGSSLAAATLSQSGGSNSSAASAHRQLQRYTAHK